MAKKVLHVFGIMNRGGAELRTLSLMPALKAKGVEFEFCALSGQQGVLDESINAVGSQVHYCKLGVGFFWRFYRLLKQQQFDVVHSHVSLVSGVMLWIAWLAGVPLRIAHFRNTTDVENISVVRQWRDKLLKRMILSKAHHVLAVCEGALQGYWSECWQQDKRFKVIYNGFERPELETQDNFWQQYINQYDNGVVITNVARMDYQKNHLRQAKIFAEYLALNNQAWLVFIGKENRRVRQTVEDFCQQQGIRERVVFLGEQAKVLPFLRHSQLMLFPSMWEGLPGAVIEAASVGTPVVASDIPGVLEIASALTLVSPLSLQSTDVQWAQKIADVLAKPMSQQDVVAEFDHSQFQINANVDALHAIYTK